MSLDSHIKCVRYSSSHLIVFFPDRFQPSLLTIKLFVFFRSSVMPESKSTGNALTTSFRWRQIFHQSETRIARTTCMNEPSVRVNSLRQKFLPQPSSRMMPSRRLKSPKKSATSLIRSSLLNLFFFATLYFIIFFSLKDV